MGSDWNRAHLTDLYDISSGLSKPAKFFGSGFPFVAFKDVMYNFFLPRQLSQLVQSTEEEQRKCSVKRGDVFLTRTSETMNELGMSSVAVCDYENATFNGFTKRLRPKPGTMIVPEFIAYYLRSPKFRAEMRAFSTMSTRASLNNEMISRLKISFPSVSEQRAIGHVLKTLDDKIELNRRMNKTLESMARALFKSWFVDFDPVIDNALAAGNSIPEPLAARAETRRALGETRKPLPDNIRSLFPATFAFDEEMGWIPEGWATGLFKDVATHIRDNVPAEELHQHELYVGLEHIGRKELFLSNGESTEAITSNKSAFQKYDLLFGKLRPYFHKVCIAPSPGICSTDILVFRPRGEGLTSFMTMLAYSDRFVEYADLHSTGTRMPRASAKDMLNFDFVVPPELVACEFNSLTTPLWDKGIANVAASEAAGKLRDTLLPKLLSGELRIPEAEKLVADSV